MNAMFELDSFMEEYDVLLTSMKYMEFLEDLNALDALLGDEVIYEEVNDPRETKRNRKHEMVKNTVQTTKDIANAYYDTTKGLGKVMKTGWDIMMSAVNLIVRVVVFICDSISKIPKVIENVFATIASIPKGAKAKIKGDMSIYITKDDIQQLYQRGLLKDLITFVSLASELMKGDTWGKITTPRHDQNNERWNDMDIIKKMRVCYHDIENISFNQTTVNMKDQDTVNLYWDNAKSIHFTTLKGEEINCDYSHALTHMAEDIRGSTEQLQIIKKAIGEKYKASLENGSYAKLNHKQQDMVNEIIPMISKVISVIGNLLKCVMSDMSMMKKTGDAIIKQAGRTIKQGEKKFT